MSGLERKDSGVYKVKAKNTQGEDEVEVRVNVIGPPDKPKGPLEVSDVRSTRERTFGFDLLRHVENTKF